MWYNIKNDLLCFSIVASSFLSYRYDLHDVIMLNPCMLWCFSQKNVNGKKELHILTTELSASDESSDEQHPRDRFQTARSAPTNTQGGIDFDDDFSSNTGAMPQPLQFPISLALDIELTDTTAIGHDFPQILALNPG